MSRFLGLIFLLVIIVMPNEIYGQNNLRNKNKTTKNTSSQIKSATKTQSNRNSNAQTVSDVKKQQKKTEEEIRLTESRIKENDIKVGKSLVELSKLDNEITETKKRIKTIEGKLNTLGIEINSLEGKIGKNEEDLKKLQEEYLKAVKKMRITKKNKSFLAFIFSSENISQALRRMRYLKEFSAWRERRTEEINEKVSTLKIQKTTLAKAQAEQEKTLVLLKADQLKLTDQHKRQEILVGELKKNGEALASHLKRKQAEAKDLGSKISFLIAEEQQKAEKKRKEEEQRKSEELRKAEESRILAENNNKEKEDIAEDKKTKAAPSDSHKPSVSDSYANARKRAPRQPSDNKTQEKVTQKKTEASNSETENGVGSFENMKGKLPFPNTGSFVVVSKFGRQQLPELPGVEFDNPGIDAQTEAGASARSVYQGKVSGVYLLPGYNNVVIVNHGDYYTVYGNLLSPVVKTGDSVAAGSILGSLALSEDDSSHSTIHFEVWKNRDKLNPQEWLR